MPTAKPAPDPRGLSWRIDVGPLPARWGRAGFGLLCGALAALFVLFGLRTTTLDCERELEHQPSCTLSDSPPLPTVNRFPPGSIARIQEVHESPGKGPGYWTVFILDQRGAQRRVESYDSRAAATALGDRIRTYLADGRVPHFRFASQPDYAKAGLISVIALLMLGVLLRNAFHQAGHLLLDIDRVHHELRVRRKLFGMPYGRTARFALAELSDVQLEYGAVQDKLATHGQLPAPGARFVLVRSGGRRYPVTPHYLPGPAQFEQGLRLLRAELGFDEERRDSQCQEPEHNHPASREPVRPSAVGARVWDALFSGGGTSAHARRVALVAAAVLGVALLLFMRNTSSKQSKLELQAEYRCTFQGMDILPGGEMSTTLEPGRYEIRVFNSAAPGGWESQVYALHAGQSLRVTCRPRRAKR